jgi:hypothetical protein
VVEVVLIGSDEVTKRLQVHSCKLGGKWEGGIIHHGVDEIGRRNSRSAYTD